MWWRPVCFYQKLRLRLDVGHCQVLCILNLLPRVHFEFRTKSLWFRQLADTLPNLDSKLLQSLYTLGTSLFSVHYAYKSLPSPHPPPPAFSPCSILWLCRIANITENISFPCVFTVSVLWFHDFDQGFMFWHPDALGVLVPCQIGTSQAFQMVSFHWDGCSLESYSFALGLTKRCGYSVDVSSKRDFWVTHKIFPMLFPSLGVFHWFLPLEKSLN